MNDDIKNALNADLPAGRVPFTLDPDRAVALGRRGRKRRKLMAGGTSALSVVAVAGLIVAVLTPGAPSGSDDAADRYQTPVDELPELDPDMSYQWLSGMSQFETTPTSKAYTKAFWQYMDKEHPEAELDNTQYIVEGQPTTPPTKTPALELDKRELIETGKDGSGETIYTHPVLTIKLVHDNGGAGNIVFQFGDDMPNYFDIDVLPKGTYRVGSKDAYDLTTCPEDEPGAVFVSDCEATRTEGPDGERVEHVRVDKTRAKDDKLTGATHKSIVYRENGTAVIVTNTIRGWHGGSDKDEGKDIEGQDPALSFDELTAIALALPDEPVG